MTILERIGFRIKLERRLQGYSQRDLARALEISYSYLSMIENGKRDMSLSTFIDIVIYLDIDLNSLKKEIIGGLI